MSKRFDPTEFYTEMTIDRLGPRHHRRVVDDPPFDEWATEYTYRPPRSDDHEHIAPGHHTFFCDRTETHIDGLEIGEGVRILRLPEKLDRSTVIQIAGENDFLPPRIRRDTDEDPSYTVDTTGGGA